MRPCWYRIPINTECWVPFKVVQVCQHLFFLVVLVMKVPGSHVVHVCQHLFFLAQANFDLRCKKRVSNQKIKKLISCCVIFHVLDHSHVSQLYPGKWFTYLDHSHVSQLYPGKWRAKFAFFTSRGLPLKSGERAKSFMCCQTTFRAPTRKESPSSR